MKESLRSWLRGGIRESLKVSCRLGRQAVKFEIALFASSVTTACSIVARALSTTQPSRRPRETLISKLPTSARP